MPFTFCFALLSWLAQVLAQETTAVDAVVLANSSESNHMFLATCLPSGILLPAQMPVSADFTLLSSMDHVAYTLVYTANNDRYTIKTGNGSPRTIMLNADELRFVKCLIFRLSGPSGNPVQTPVNLHFKVLCNQQ